MSDEAVTQLRERLARLEGEHDAVRERLERGAGTMDELRQAIFRALRAEMAPKPWTLRRILTWIFGAGVPLLGIVGAAALWLLALRDTTRDAVAGLGDAAKAITAIRADMRTMETRQAESAGAMKALHDGQSRAEDKLDRLLGRMRPKKDEE